MIDISRRLLLASMALPSVVAAQSLTYPAAHRDSVVEDYHGTKVTDPYRWLEHPESGRAPQYLEAQKSLTATYLTGIAQRDAIHKRLTALWAYARMGVPWREAGRLFYVSSSGSQAQSVLYTQNDADEQPRALLDPATISPDGSIAVGDHVVSPDGRLLAYRAAQGGADLGRIHVREIATGRDIRDVTDSVVTSVCWTHDARGFFYIRPPAPKPGDTQSSARIDKQLYYHLLGQPQAKDRFIQQWTETSRWLYCMLSEDGRYALAVVEQGTESAMYVMDLRDPKKPNVAAPLIRLLGDRAAFHTPLDIVGRTLYVRTNLDAPRNRVVALDLAEGSSARARTVVPESPDVIVDAVIAGDRIVVNYLANVTSRVRLFALDGTPSGEVALPGVGAVGWPLSARPSSRDLYYSFASFLAPRTVYRYDLRRNTSDPFNPPRVPFNASAYETKQVFYTSKDGTRVPMFITAAKGVKLDGTHPTMLTAYGGYGISSDPHYEPDIPLWLEMGGIYVVANIRGGGEYGEEWHRAGMLGRKQNSFDDFISAAEFLIAERYTTASKLAIYGRSNGGLLVGAAMTQRPDLFAAVVADAGHYDMLRYHKFTVGAGWISEFGSPDDPKAFPHLHAYSPLHNVRAGTCYPATLLLAADHDDRVVPSHAYKFAAELQAAQGCQRPVLLRVAVDASHSYASSEARIAERADMWAFVAAQLGVR